MDLIIEHLSALPALIVAVIVGMIANKFTKLGYHWWSHLKQLRYSRKKKRLLLNDLRVKRYRKEPQLFFVAAFYHVGTSICIGAAICLVGAAILMFISAHPSLYIGVAIGALTNPVFELFKMTNLAHLISVDSDLKKQASEEVDRLLEDDKDNIRLLPDKRTS